MKLKFLLDVDCVNYKKISMFLGFPNCNWKCGRALCQNSALAQEPSVDIGYEPLIQRYLNNPLSEAVVCGGLDPLDSWEELKIFVSLFREKIIPLFCFHHYSTPQSIKCSELSFCIPLTPISIYISK